MPASPSPSMKTIPKHLCTVLPRVRSNSASSSTRKYSNSSALSLFDSSAPPPSRPTLSPNRLSIEGKPAEAQNSQHNSHSHPPFSLALAQPQSSSSQTLAHSGQQGQYALFPYSSLAHSPYALPPSSHPSQDQHHHPRPKRQRLRYQLDVGAYGIPKRCRPVPSRRHGPSPSGDPTSLAVQVGEDAYFVRDNAMGVADGVGGWAKSHPRLPSSPTPSAVFARRLMHYCSAEVGTVTTPSLADPPPPPADPSPASPRLIPAPPSKYQSPLPPSRPHFSFTHHLRPRPGPSPPWAWSGSSMSSSLPASWTLHDVFSTPPNASPEPDHTQTYSFADRQSTPVEDLEQDLEDSLEELSEGIDVLQILERAYDKTLKAHVISPESTSRSERVRSQSTSPSTQGESNSRPLLEGSSTALLAILDHPPRPSQNPSPPPVTLASSSSFNSSCHSTTIIASSSSASPLSASSISAETPLGATTSTSPSATSKVECELVEEAERKGEYDAVIKIAHVGDCMGMLVRGEDIVWRSEEMWWDFNTPVQLGPTTSTSVTPRNSAMVITLPVKANDILILASDGLSDNLWDEDVLDEVVRFKKTFLDSIDNVTATTTITPKVEEEEDSGYSSESSTCSTLRPSTTSESTTTTPTPTPTTTTTLKRKSLAGMLSEALCSRARRVSERSSSSSAASLSFHDEDEIPFARRAREIGKRFCGGKDDDISVVVAVISPRGE